MVDLYTKNGAIGLYGSLLVLVPDYDVALTVLVAGPTDPESQLASIILEAFLPVIEKVGKRQAATLYTGSYESHSSRSVLNVTVDDGPGLYVNQWVSNGKDILQTYKAFRASEIGGVDLRLYPTGLKNADKVSFRGILQVLPVDDSANSQTSDGNIFSKSCTWSGIDGIQYGLNAADDFLFHVDEFGSANSVEPRILRQILKRNGTALAA